MKSGIEIISEERERQIAVEGWSSEHDDQHTDEELAQAAATYVYPDRLAYPGRDEVWPENWDSEWFKPTFHLGIQGRIKELAKAGALIAAEIDRLGRLAIT